MGAENINSPSEHLESNSKIPSRKDIVIGAIKGATILVLATDPTISMAKENAKKYDHCKTASTDKSSRYAGRSMYGWGWNGFGTCTTCHVDGDDYDRIFDSRYSHLKGDEANKKAKEIFKPFLTFLDRLENIKDQQELIDKHMEYANKYSNNPLFWKESENKDIMAGSITIGSVFSVSDFKRYFMRSIQNYRTTSFEELNAYLCKVKGNIENHR